MRHLRKIERIKSKFQFAGTVFFALLIEAVFIVKIILFPQITANTGDKPTTTVEQNVMVSVTPTVDETVLTPITIQSTAGADKQYYNIPLSTELQDYIFNLTKQYNVPTEIVIAVIERESSYRPNVTGLAGEQGLMQIHPINHERLTDALGITDFYDPKQNILAGTYMLSELFAKYDTATEALMCYNCGEAGAKRLWAKGITQTEYTVGILNFIETLETKGANGK